MITNFEWALGYISLFIKRFLQATVFTIAICLWIHIATTVELTKSSDFRNTKEFFLSLNEVLYNDENLRVTIEDSTDMSTLCNDVFYYMAETGCSVEKSDFYDVSLLVRNLKVKNKRIYSAIVGNMELIAVEYYGKNSSFSNILATHRIRSLWFDSLLQCNPLLYIFDGIFAGEYTEEAISLILFAYFFLLGWSFLLIILFYGLGIIMDITNSKRYLRKHKEGV